MSLFRFAKYSTLLFFFGKYKTKIFRIVAVLLFAAVTSLLYRDIADYLHREHPAIAIYALIGKIIVVYGALAFVLWQFRPPRESPTVKSTNAGRGPEETGKPADRLTLLQDIDTHDRLQTRYERVLRQHTTVGKNSPGNKFQTDGNKQSGL